MGDETPQNPLTSGAIKKKKDDKHRRRDPRSWENIKKAILGMNDEERDAYIAKIYNDIYNENRTLAVNLQAREKQLQVVQKDSDRDRSELTKSILARGQLESLCRELQKQNRLIKEENVARIKEEEDRRREVANTFTERLNALTNLITESKDKSNKVKEENQNMTEKLTELYEQYQQRENHLETVTKQLDLQKKLAETQAKKTEIEHEAERQTYIAEKKALVMQLEQYEREIVLLQEKNRSLEAQVDLYKSQYSDFETTMTKSNKVFDTFKEEMSRMNKQLHALESERNDLRKRWQSSVNSLIVLSEQHVALSNEQSALEKRLAMLQKLCRQLQEDRSAFLKQLKENNIEPIVPTTVKNNENCEKDASEANSNTTKSTQRALKLKQELGKVKEVAALIKLGHQPPVADPYAEADLSDLLDQHFDSIQQQIEASDAQIEEYFEDGAAAADLKPKRFKASEDQQGEGDSQVAGPSRMIDEEPLPKVRSESHTQTRILSTQDYGSQSEPSTSEASSQPEVIEIIDLDDALSVRRAPAATDLIREQIPSIVNLTESDSTISLDNLHSVSDNGLGSSTSESTLGGNSNAGIENVDSNDDLINLAEEIINVEDSSTSSSSDDTLMPRALVREVEEDEVKKDDRNKKMEEEY